MNEEEKKVKNNEINLEDLDVDKINELMDLESLENENLEELDENISSLDDIENTSEELEKTYSKEKPEEEIPELEIEDIVEEPDMNEVEKLAEELEKTDSEEKPEAEEIPELEIEDTVEEPYVSEVEKVVEENTVLEGTSEQIKAENIKEKNIPEQEKTLESVNKDKKVKENNEVLYPKIENEIIVPEYETKEDNEKIQLVEKRLFSKLEEYENRINELVEKNKRLEEKLEGFYSKMEKSEQAISILLKNLVSMVLGDRNDIFNSLLNIKSLISEKNKIYLINIAEKFKDKISEEYDFVYNYIMGNLYSETKEISKAEKYYLRALRDCEKDKSLDMQFNLSVIQNNLGALYADSNKYDLAEKYFKESLEVRRKLIEKNENYNYYLYNSLNNLGMLEIKLGNLDTAENYLNEALEISSKIEITTEDRALLFKNLGNLYSEKAMEEKAKEYYEKSLKEYLKLYDNDKYNYREKVDEIMKLLSKFDPNVYEKYTL